MAKLGPKMAQLGPKMAELGPIIAKLGPKMAELGPRMAKLGPKLTKLGPKMANLDTKMAKLEPRMAKLGPKRAKLGHQKGPPGLCPMSTPPESLHTDKIIQEKNIEPVSFKNWHRQNNLNLRHRNFFIVSILSVFHDSGFRQIRAF